MTTYIAHFAYPGTGVQFQMTMTHEHKHYSLSRLDEACVILADRLSAMFLYYEEQS